MQQTTKYHFNIIDPSDDFSPKPLNENAQKLEDALIAHEGAVSAALAAKADKTALDAQKSQLDAADKALSQTITAVEKGANLYHLAGPMVRSSTSDPVFSVDLSGIDINQYRALLVIARVGARGEITAGSIKALVSATEGFYTGSMVWFLNTGTTVTVLTKTVSYNTITGYYGASLGGQFSETGWSQMTRISGNSTVMTMDVYGLKA